jgi:hypothetical protein
MRMIVLRRAVVFAALALGMQALAAASALAQALPPGSYLQSCTQLHWAGTTLVAECATRDGRYTGTGLPNALACRGEIANIDGQLRCLAAGGPPPGYGAPAPGYGRPGYGGYDERRERCEELWRRHRELRERLEVTPWGPDRERIEYRLRETREDRERLGCSE